METILGIDLGTTNSAAAVIQDGKPVMIKDQQGQAILPSVVGLDADGQLLVGQQARNQAIVAPERTVRSIKRRMGQETTVPLGPQQYSPQEISAMILRTLKDRAAQVLGLPVQKAVITVPAYFSETQREATRQAGQLAGLDVVRIINEPTAAALVYRPRSDRRETLLVYDLGGGTFDVSIVQIEQGVVEVLASHGDTQLGGDDFDQLLLDWVCDDFARQHGVDLRQSPVARSRLLQAVEEAKKRLSTEAYTRLAEEFIAEKEGQPLNLDREIDRLDYEQLIQGLMDRTLRSVDEALSDAQLHAGQIDKIILVGGSSRTPMVHRLLEDQLGLRPHLEVDPDLCVAMGAAVQGGMIAGIDVGPILVDITPRTLGIEAVGVLHGALSPYCFSPIIKRNTPLPATRSEIYYTGVDGQQRAEIHVLQGEHEDSRHNTTVGKFMLENLDEQASRGNEILVRFDLDLDGILTVTAVERATGNERRLTIDNAISRFEAQDRGGAEARLAELIEATPQDTEQVAESDGAASREVDQLVQHALRLMAKARLMAGDAPPEDADEIRRLVVQLEEAAERRSLDPLRDLSTQLEDLLFYLEEA